MKNSYDSYDKKFDIENGILKKYFGRKKCVIIPDSVQYIANGAFQNNRSINEVIIPDSVIEIGENAFMCSSLERLEIGKGLITIKKYAFFECKNLKIINISSNNIYIYQSAFSCCDNVEGIFFEEGIYEIKNEFFEHFKYNHIKYVSIPKSAILIDDLYSLKYDVVIGCKPNSVGFDYAEKKSLQKVVFFPDGSICDERDYWFDIIFNEQLRKYSGKGDDKIIIPQKFTEIEKKAFDSTQDIVQVIIPGTIEKIKTDTFYFCPKLRTVIIEEGVKIIDYNAFHGCDISAIHIPKSVEKINDFMQITYEKWKNLRIYGYKNTAAEKFANESQLFPTTFIDIDSILP